MKKYILTGLLIICLASCGGSGQDAGAEEGHGHGHGGTEGSELVLSERQMKAVGIRLGHIERRSMADLLSATGRLEVSPQDEAVVSSTLPGKISSLCVSIGQNVKAGQVVAFVEAPELQTLRMQCLEAGQETAAALSEYERQKKLAEQGAGIRKNLESARNALEIARIREQGLLERLKDTGGTLSGGPLPVRAPISGIITAVEATVGAFADAQVPIARIVNHSGIYCMLNILEKDLAKVNEGMAVEMRLTNDPANTFPGKIAAVTPFLDDATKSVPVKVSIDLPSSSSMLIPGMAVSAQINATGSETDVLPEGAVVNADGKTYIFVLSSGDHEHTAGHEDHGHSEEPSEEHHEHEDSAHEHSGEFVFRKVEVITGVTSFGYTAISPLSPLPQDAEIVTEGAFYLNSMSSDHGEHNH